MIRNVLRQADTGYTNKCFEDDGFRDSTSKDSVKGFAHELHLKDEEPHDIDHYEDLDTMARTLVDHLQNSETLRLNSISRRKKNELYTPTNQKRKAIVNHHSQPRYHSTEHSLTWLTRKRTVLYVALVASLAFWAVGLLYAQGFDCKQGQSITFRF